MKFTSFLICAASLFPFTSLAAGFQLECRSTFNSGDFDFEIKAHSPYDYGNAWAQLWDKKTDPFNPTIYMYDIYNRERRGLNEIWYWGHNMVLKINLGFDSEPKLYFPYRSSFQAADFNRSQAIHHVDCEYLQ